MTWKKTTLANARPGDMLIKLDSSGYAMHVSIYVSEATGVRAGQPKTSYVYTTDATPNSSGVYYIGWANTNDPKYFNLDVYTAYPD